MTDQNDSCLAPRAIELSSASGEIRAYGEWSSILGDPIIATVILDHLLHHSTTVNIRGESPFASRSRSERGDRTRNA